MKYLLAITFLLVFSFSAFGAKGSNTECTYSVSSPNYYRLPAREGTGTINLTTQSGCTWEAVSNSDWLTITDPKTGSGSATISFKISANISPRRSGGITVGGQTLGFEQNNGCHHVLTPSTFSFTATGGPVSFTDSAAPGCFLYYASYRSSAQGMSDGSVVYANNGPARGGQLVYIYTADYGAGSEDLIQVSISLSQSSGCLYYFSPFYKNVVAGGDTQPFNLGLSQSSSYLCGAYSGTFTVSDPWITLDTINKKYTVAPNLGLERSGQFIADTATPGVRENFIIKQDSGCIYSLSASSANFGATGSGGIFDMHTYSPCTWTITPQVDWITITSNQNANGNGTVGYLVAANSGAARTGTINAQGQTFTVNQAGATPTPTPTPNPTPMPSPSSTPACTYTLGTTSQTFTSSGGTGSIDVQTQPGCAWTAANNDSMITLSKSSGTGNGTITFDVAANSTGTTRTTTITVQGQIFTVTQSGGKTRKRVRFF